MNKLRFTSAHDARRFLLGGHAIVTLVSKRTGAWFTYRVSQSDDKRVYFVVVLTGTDNTGHYTYIGFMRDGDNIRFRHSTKKGITRSALSVQAFIWMWDHLRKVDGPYMAPEIPKDLEIWHEGRCGRCGRRLTVPSSIATGFGPECADALGIEPALSRDLRRVNERQRQLL